MLTFRNRFLTIFKPIIQSQIGKKLIVWLLIHMDFTLPIDRLYESKTLLAFFHPQPTYSFHILLLPKENIPDLQTLGEDHTEFLQEVITTSQKLIADFELNQYGYRLIVNGGEFQEFPILHFHLISDKIITQTKDLS